MEGDNKWEQKRSRRKKRGGNLLDGTAVDITDAGIHEGRKNKNSVRVRLEKGGLM